MRKAVASLLIGFLGLAVQDYAAPQEGRPAIKQKVKKAAMQAAVHTYVFYHGEPQFSWIEGTSITYATNAPESPQNRRFLLFSLSRPKQHGRGMAHLCKRSRTVGAGPNCTGGRHC